jgi:hypothetical protein
MSLFKRRSTSPPPAAGDSQRPERHPVLGRGRFIALAAVVTVAAVCTTYAAWQWSSVARTEPLRPLEMSGQWIQTPDEEAYGGHFRREFRLPGHVRNAWLAIGACDGFEVTVNGAPAGCLYVWRPTRPFQYTLSERGQRVSFPTVALALNVAREYQWEVHRHYLLPTFLDLTPYLHLGKNVICVEIEARRPPAKVRFDGAIELVSGESIKLASGTGWLAEPLPPDYQNLDWRGIDYRSLGWRHAVCADPPPGQPLQAFDPRIFSTAFRGSWIRHPAANAQDSVWFETEWQCDRAPDDAWLRIATNRNFDLFINGERGFPATPDRTGLESGDWIFGSRRAADPTVYPESLHTTEVGDLFIRQRFEPPRRGGPADWDIRKQAAAQLQWPNDRRPGALEQVAPKDFARDLAAGGYFAYNLRGLLHQGSNQIAIRLNRPESPSPADWSGQIAADGEVSFGDGTRQALASDGKWTCRCLGADSTEHPAFPAEAEVVNRARRAETPLAALQYRGTPIPHEVWAGWVAPAAFSAIAALLGMFGLLAVVALVSRRWAPGVGPRSLPPPVRIVASVLFDAILVFAVVIGMLVALQTVLGERSEQLWFLQPQIWQWGFLTAGVLGIAAALARILRMTGMARLRATAVRLGRLVRALPGTILWRFAVVWISLFILFLRVYALDFQPMDDDEYPSAMAIVSIARTGVPSYVPQAVWYTRSPLYHYITGASVWAFGENLWAMRIPTALFSVGTGVLTYLFGSRIMKRPWVGMAALVLATLHPQMVFTGHMVRFYQQQQFFALLVFYWFCKGFVTEQSQKYRYLTMAAILAAVLSQEITAVVIPQIVIGYLLFGENKSIRENIKLFVVAVCVVAVIAVDWMLYQTHCLTRLEGFSPFMQADVQPHIWEPYNTLTVFLSYSRIHVVLSIVLILGLPAALRERNRVSMAMHFLLFSGVVLTNLLVTQVSVRYVYWLFPLLFLLAIDNTRAGLAWLSSLGGFASRRRREFGFAPALCSLVVLAAMVAGFAPWRIPSTYGTKLLGDSSGAFQYIRSQLRPGDIVVAHEPHGKGAYMEIGQVDYELQIPIIYDFVLYDNGELVDRGSGARAMVSLEQLQKVCASHDRVWVAINRDKFQTRGQRLLWEHPTARTDLFLRENLQMKRRGYLWWVYLWDAREGLYRQFRRNSPT